MKPQPKFEIFPTQSGQKSKKKTKNKSGMNDTPQLWQWRLLGPDGETIATSEKTYEGKQAVITSIDATRLAVAQAHITDESEQGAA